MGLGRWSLACVLLAFAAAGCGGSDPRGVDPVASAADRTLDKQTGRFEAILGEPSLGWMVPSGSGSFSVPDEAMDLTMSCCPGPTDAMTVLKFRMLYPVGYAGYEQIESFLHPTVRRWVEVDLQRTLEKQLSTLEQAFQVGITHSPVGGLALLRGSKHAKKLGAEMIDGVRTTHYRVSVDLEEAFAKATPKERTALSLARRQDGKAAPARIDVWVGDDGLVGRMRREFAHGTMTTTFSHLGASVHVEAPPAYKTVGAH
jgi:hypothetical protein